MEIEATHFIEAFLLWKTLWRQFSRARTENIKTLWIGSSIGQIQYNPIKSKTFFVIKTFWFWHFRLFCPEYYVKIGLWFFLNRLLPTSWLILLHYFKITLGFMKTWYKTHSLLRALSSLENKETMRKKSRR